MKEDMRGLWQDMEQAHTAFNTILGQFLRGDKPTRLALLMEGFKTNRYLALTILQRVPIEDLEELFPFLMSHARSVHPYLGHVRETILRLPKEWLIQHIEAVADPLLKHGTYDDYRRFLELYLTIDPAITKRLAVRAADSHDPDIREAGEDFLEKLTQSQR